MSATVKTPQQYVALLRSINVGGNCRVEMSRLKRLCTNLGFGHVRTYINSGNVIFSSVWPVERIEQELTTALRTTFSFDIPLVLRTLQDLQRVCRAAGPKWQNDAEQRTDVLFLWSEVDTRASLKKIVTTPKVDELRYTPGAIVWHFHRRFYTKSSMHKFIGTPIYKRMTARNINTVRKLVDLMAAS